MTISVTMFTILIVFAATTSNGLRMPKVSARTTASPEFTSSLCMTQHGSGPHRGPDKTPILDSVRLPSDMKNLDLKQLQQLSNELRWDVINAVSKTGGHLSSSLGVVELTVALHYVFNAPKDKIVWDVAHQCYPHKILTGRREKMDVLRKLHGISGFTNRQESEYDCFGAGHSSTSISAALGMSAAKKHLNLPTNNCIAVIGDGAITGGMAYEAMNNAAYINSRVIVVLNDNGQVSLPTGQPSAGGVIPAGALSGYTSRLLTSNTFKNVRDIAKGLNSFMPEGISNLNKKVDEYVRGMVSGGTLFEELGFYYVGPVDAHDIENLVPILENIRDKVPLTKPVLLHVKSVKGKGYPPAEAASDRMHGVAKFDVSTGKQNVVQAKTPSLTSVFANSLISIMETDRDVTAITAAMPGGTGLDKVGRRFPKRTFDVGIAEQHAVTFAAGMAVEGVKPFCAIYSTFFQRGYDQFVHDVALQKLPVRFILDRAGLVGNDGATHHGTYDLAYMACIPDIVLLAPSDEVELQDAIETIYAIDDMPSCVRYPRASGYGPEAIRAAYDAGVVSEVDLARATKGGQCRGKALEIGKGRVVKGAHLDPVTGAALSNGKTRVTILSIGSRLMESLAAARAFEESHPDTTVAVADARFMKPLDHTLITQLAEQSDVILTIEEGSIGGFGSHVQSWMSDEGLLDGDLLFRSMVIPDKWIEQGPQKDQYDIAQLNSPHIQAKIEELVQRVRARASKKRAKTDGARSVQSSRSSMPQAIPLQ